MPYVPRLAEDIRRDLASRFVARSPSVDDLREGSVLYVLLASVAEQIAEADVRLNQIMNQFTLEGASGTDLDARASEIGVTRNTAKPASGSVTLTRTDTTSALTIPAGSVIGRTDSDVTYSVLSAITLAIGVSSGTVTVVAQVSGTEGNAPANTLNRLVDVPDAIIGIQQTTALVNGAGAESDESLRTRARLAIDRLTRCTSSALRYEALSFKATDETQASVATVYEPVSNLGYVELLIDDGTGLGDQPITRSGQTVQLDVVSNEGPWVIGIERALVNETISIQRNRGGTLSGIPSEQYSLSLGRGTIYISEDADVQAGDIITASLYRVYDGLVRELQDHLEGVAGDSSTGFRPAGVDLRVVPAPTDRVSLNLLVTTADGANLTEVISDAETATTNYLSTLEAGAPAFIAGIIDVVMDVTSVINVKVLTSSNTDATDIYPSTPRHVIRADIINAITSTTVSS